MERHHANGSLAIFRSWVSDWLINMRMADVAFDGLVRRGDLDTTRSK
jgi:hypothetical protein